MTQEKLLKEQILNNTYQKAILAEVSKEKEPANIEYGLYWVIMLNTSCMINLKPFIS